MVSFTSEQVGERFGPAVTGALIATYVILAVFTLYE